jgi:HAD superfamily hydrolase (TIGR01490 family)
MSSADKDASIPFYQCHIFDLDHTLIAQNTSFAYLNFLCAREVLPKKSLYTAWLSFYKYKTRSSSLKQIHEVLFSTVLKGVAIQDLESCAEKFLDETLWNSIYPPAFSKFRLQQHLGASVALMSSSPSFLVERISHRLGADHWEATEYQSDSFGCLQSVKRFLDGAGKASEVFELAKTKGLPLDQCMTYSDSFYDLPFLLTSGKAVAVNPDKRLRFFALKNQWEIL